MSYRVATLIGVGVFLGASFLGWLGDSRPVWAQDSSVGPVTYEFRVDRLEVETQDKSGASKQVIVRNGADQDDNIEFTVEARSKGGASGRSSFSQPKDGNTQPQLALSFLDEPLDLTLRSPSDQQQCNGQDEWGKKAKTAPATVFVSHTGSKESLQLQFSTIMRKATAEEGITRPGDVEVCLNDKTDSPDAVIPEDVDTRAFDIVLKVKRAPDLIPGWPTFNEWFRSSTPPEDWSTLTGYLVVHSPAHPQTAPATLRLQLTSRPQWSGRLFVLILFFAGVWALGARTYVYMRLGRLAREIHPSKRKQWLSEKLPFEFRTGWAANLTTTGAILGTFLSAGVLPTDTVFMSKELYISLNVLFGLILLFAGVIHSAGQNGKSFLRAYALTLGAGVGELITALLILEEIGFQHSMPTPIVRVMQIALIVAACFITYVASSDAVKRIKTPKTKGGLV